MSQFGHQTLNVYQESIILSRANSDRHVRRKIKIIIKIEIKTCYHQVLVEVLNPIYSGSTVGEGCTNRLAIS